MELIEIHQICIKKHHFFVFLPNFQYFTRIPTPFRAKIHKLS